MTVTPSASKPAIAIVDVDVGISSKELNGVAHALQIQVNRDFSLPPPHGYGISCTIRVAKSMTDIKPNEWVMGLYKTPDIQGALGYHDETPSGQPLMKIFPLLDTQAGQPWSPTASHELLETLADPNICRAVQDSTGKFWAYEVCDGVENDSYVINGYYVSNFALPPYFEPPSNLTGVKLDYMGLCTTPMETRPGGYNQYWDGQQWQQILAQKPAANRSAKKAGGRGERRRMKHISFDRMCG